MTVPRRRIFLKGTLTAGIQPPWAVVCRRASSRLNGRANENENPTSGEVIEVLCVVNHPMETGQRVGGKTNRKIPAHYIQKMIFKLNRQQVAVADTGTGVSRRPLIAVRLKSTKTGDTISVNWTDNMGESGSAHTTIA